jgi:hypothetical protein
MNFADIISSAWGFSPLDSIFVLAVLALIVAGLKKNHGLKKEERELTEKIASFMTETGTKKAIEKQNASERLVTK